VTVLIVYLLTAIGCWTALLGYTVTAAVRDQGFWRSAWRGSVPEVMCGLWVVAVVWPLAVFVGVVFLGERARHKKERP